MQILLDTPQKLIMAGGIISTIKEWEREEKAAAFSSNLILQKTGGHFLLHVYSLSLSLSLSSQYYTNRQAHQLYMHAAGSWTVRASTYVRTYIY